MNGLGGGSMPRGAFGEPIQATAKVDIEARFPLGAAATWAELDDDPYPLLARIRASEPITWFAPLRGWAVLCNADCEQVLRDEQRFISNLDGSKPYEIFGRQMLNLDGAEHRRHRTPFESPFRLRAVRERFAEPIASHCNQLLGALRDENEAELSSQFAAVLPIQVIRDVLSLRLPHDVLRAIYDDFAAALGDYKGGHEVDRRALASRRRLDADLRAEIARLRDCPDTATLSAALAGDAELSEDEIVANALVIMFGGIETTETLILNTLFGLLTHPDQLALVRADPSRIGDAIDESLRWVSPLGHPGRHTADATTIRGVELSPGAHVYAIIAAANRDPEVFDTPDVFDIGRPNSRQSLSFGHGPHFCLGFNLAKLEAGIAIASLLERYPALTLDPEHEPPRLRGFSFRKPAALHVRLQP